MPSSSWRKNRVLPKELPAGTSVEPEDAILVRRGKHAGQLLFSEVGQYLTGVPWDSLTGVPDLATQAELDAAIATRQPLDATLTALAGVAAAADKLPFFSGVDTAAVVTFPAYARTLVQAVDASAALTTLGVSAFIKTLLDDADAAAARATLGLASGATTTVGTMATQNADAVAITGGSASGLSSVSAASLRATGSLGYPTGGGTGGAVTQATSKTTAVTLNTITGTVTTSSAALAGNASVGFAVNNSQVTARDTVIVNVSGNANYRAQAYYVDTGAFGILLTNLTGGSLSEAVQLNFAVIKASNN